MSTPHSTPGASREFALALGQFPADSEEENFESALHNQDSIFFVP